MTTRGRLLGFGNEWTVTRGAVIGFLGVDFAVLLFHTGGPKEDLWLTEVTGNYIQSLFFCRRTLGSMDFIFLFQKAHARLSAPSYGNASGPFEPIRKFTYN